MKKTLIILILAAIGFFVYLVVDTILVIAKQDYLQYNSSNVDVTHIPSVSDALSYQNYVNSKPLNFPNEEIVIMAADYTLLEGDHVVVPSFEGVLYPLLTDETGKVTWEVDINEAGFYYLDVDYYPYLGKSGSIERRILINDELPFSGASQIIFHRLWGNQGEILKDIAGNDIRPSQIELPKWTKGSVKDSTGYISNQYYFYFEEGINKITFESIREPLLLDKIVLKPVKDLKTYDEIKNLYEANNYKVANESINIVQAENASYTTSPTLYALNDRTSAATMKNSPKLIRLNTIGGTNWNIAGDKITWEFEVNESGLYEISLRVKQRLASGMNVFRNIYINDEIPFKELENYSFNFSRDWRIQTLGTNDEPFLFYLEEGKNTLTMEVTLGLYGELIQALQTSINNLNRIYREILIYTGPEPDRYRDYELEKRIPDLVSRLQAELDTLQLIRQSLIDISGSKSEKTGILDTVILQLIDFVKKPRDIHKNLSTYVSNVSSLGTLVILLSSQPLEIDYFVFHKPGETLPRNRVNFFKRTWYNIRAFVATFTIDYSQVGRRDTGTVNETINVWMSQGQDQANVMRKLIDETFAPQHQIQVDLKLVAGNALLPATLAGKGPDVALGLDNSTPVNYAMRNASYDLSQFDDFEEITQRFKASALVPLNYNNGYFGLPEQQIFLMMFYRTDIFEELGFTPPNTWQEVIEMIPSLQKYNLEFYLPIPITQGSVASLPPNPIFSTMFYQNDGEFYIDGNKKSGFDEGKGPEVFETWSRFYTDYSFPVEANFINRFRSGQMPIGISYYNTYNSLSVFAPEIRGKWNFMLVPGTAYIDEYGNKAIRRETVSSGTSAMILKHTKKLDASWEFLKWWTSTETQVRFGREMEGILGAAARYPTANIEAMERLPWTLAEFQMLNEQWDWVRGIPEVPGGYMTGRHLDNAFRLVYNESANPRETIYDYVQIINEEIAKKRREFNLD